MDAHKTPIASTGIGMGGTVEPESHTEPNKSRQRTVRPQSGERYELRDPFAEVTYRTTALAEMIQRADQLGSTRFSALAVDGKRTPITKTHNAWHRGEQLPALAPRPMEVPSDEPALAASPASAREASKLTGARLQLPLPLAEPARTPASADTKAAANAERTAKLASLEAGLREKYIIKRAPVTLGPVSLGHTEYRFRGDTSRIAFTESTFRLSTDTNSPSVARSMVDVAQTRNWSGLRVSGSEDFRRMVWLEASARGVKTVGYEPDPTDMVLLKRERDARQANRIEPTQGVPAKAPANPEERPSARGGGRKAVVAAIEAILVAKRVPEAKRVAVLAAATEQLAQRTRAGQSIRVKVYDPAAPTQRPPTAHDREINRSRERTPPVQTR